MWLTLKRMQLTAHPSCIILSRLNVGTCQYHGIIMLTSVAIAAIMDSRLILVVIGVIAMAFGRSEAVTCYSCTSETDSRCLDPFNSRGVRTCQGVSCAKGRATESGK